MGRKRSNKTSFVTASVVRTRRDNAADVVVAAAVADDDDFSSPLLIIIDDDDDDDVPHLRAFFGIRPAKDFGNFVRIRSSTIEEVVGVEVEVEVVLVVLVILVVGFFVELDDNLEHLDSSSSCRDK